MNRTLDSLFISHFVNHNVAHGGYHEHETRRPNRTLFSWIASPRSLPERVEAAANPAIRRYHGKKRGGKVAHSLLRGANEILPWRRKLAHGLSVGDISSLMALHDYSWLQDVELYITLIDTM